MYLPHLPACSGRYGDDDLVKRHSTPSMAVNGVRQSATVPKNSHVHDRGGAKTRIVVNESHDVKSHSRIHANFAEQRATGRSRTVDEKMLAFLFWRELLT